MRPAGRRLRALGWALPALLAVGCGSTAGSAPPAPSWTAPTPATVPSAAARPSSVAIPAAASPVIAGTPSPTAAPGDTPPAAALAAEGGDPVTGQLGTYVWADTGSDAPWLPGAEIRVGAGEPLSVALTPPAPVDIWTARSTPASASDPSAAIDLGAGTGTPSFAAPSTGDWTVEVGVTFADDVGHASYFWHLRVGP